MPFPNNTSLSLTAQLISSQLSNTIASAVKAAGVPPIDNPQPVSILFNQSIAAGADFTSPRLTFAQYQSVVGTFFAQEASAPVGTNPYYRVRLQWSLVADNYDPLVTEDWGPAAGPFSFVSNYRNDYASPCYGDTLTITIHNYDSKAINLTWGLFGSFRTRSRSVMRGRYPDDLSNEANGLGSDDILVATQFANVLTGTQSAKQIMQLFEGPVTVSCFYGGAPAVGSCSVNIDFQPVSVLGLASYEFANDHVGFMTPVSVTFPRRVGTIAVTNGSGATLNPSVYVVGQVQPN